MSGSASSTARLPESAANYLELSKISKKFGHFTALDQVSLCVREGEFVCLLGPSGCGKTTLLRIIAGLETADSGTVRQRGRDITREPPARRDYGIVFQSYALFPNLTVAENIAYGLTEHREQRRHRVRELLNLIEIPGNKYPAQLSGGQQQRVALARAIATSPGLLLLDEPLSALDAQVREHLRGEIKALQRKLGITAIMVTHDQEEALTMADRVVVMNHGYIEQIGQPEVIYREPASRFVANFVGQSNWLTGTVLEPGKIRLGNGILNAPATAACARGSHALIFLRPEEVLLHPHWEDAPNSALAELKHLELLGSHYRLSLTIPHWGGVKLLADVSHRQLQSLRYQSGEQLPIQLPAESLRYFGIPEAA